ncbi:putative sulfate exporter family transporter [uncultured Tateyamaria sp.]|uniref:YeiH family protein n=1 Tax=uncultured Tateyamaria sp. TaxID=455651 RepID=UPI00261C87B0|nr:putative sulfate exporter family transporter [uncultured Tateyamaria sp.]
MPGIIVAGIIALAAQFLSEHYGVPAMLMALLLGIALHFLSEEGACPPGIELCATTVLRIGVALLGARISFELLLALGVEMIALVLLGVILTVLLGLAVSYLLGRGWRLGLLTGGSVAICGASAAIAIAAVLPKNEHSDRNLSFTILSVTVLSTIAMIVYPIVGQSIGLSTDEIGVFLGGTIHDVAQVVGAGFSVSQEAGDAATLIKLFRVATLAPFILLLSIMFRGMRTDKGAAGVPIVPSFIIGFLVLATLNSFGLLPEWLSSALGQISQWALLTAIAAVGLRTSLRRVLEVGPQAIVMIISETVFIALVILGGIYWTRHVFVPLQVLV